MVLFPGCSCCGAGVCCPPTQEYIDAFRPLVCGQDGDIYSISLVKTPADYNGTPAGDSFDTGVVGGAVTARIETPGIYWRLESDLPKADIPNATGWTWERRYLTDISPNHADEDRGVFFRLDFDDYGGNLFVQIDIGCDLNDPDNLWLRFTVVAANGGGLPYFDLLWVEVDGVRQEVLPDPGVPADYLHAEVKLTKSQAANMRIAAGWSLTNWNRDPNFFPIPPAFGHYEMTLAPLPEPLQDWSCSPAVSPPDLPDCSGTAPEGCEPAESLEMVQKFTVHSVTFSGLGYDTPVVPDTDYADQIRNWLDGLEFRYSPFPGDPKLYASGGYESCWECKVIPGAENTQGYLSGGINDCLLKPGTTSGQASFPCISQEMWLDNERCWLGTTSQCAANLGLPDGYTMELRFVPNVEANGFVKLVNGVGSSIVETLPAQAINGPPSSAPSSPSAIVWVWDATEVVTQQYRVFALHLESLYTVTVNPLP